MMGSKAQNNEERHACTLATDTETPHRQQKIQKIELNENIEQDQETRSLKMIPTISKHRCNSNSMFGPSNIQKTVSNFVSDIHPNPIMRSLNLESLLSTTLSNNSRASVQHGSQHGQNLFVEGEMVEANTFGFVECSTPEETRNCEEGDDVVYDYEYDETFAPMIVDAADSGRLEDCVTKNIFGDSSDLATTNKRGMKPFCSSRKPKRSSMKKLGRSQIPSPFIAERQQFESPGDTFQILLPGCIEPIERRRTIMFDSNISILNIEPVRLLVTDGPKSLWYQECEYEAIKFKTLALLDRVDHSSGIIDGKKYCTRGLEKFMTPETTEVKKHQAWDSVLNEQFLQRKDGEYDEETLSNIYKYSTNRSKKEALKRAKLDAEAAESYLKTNFRIISSSDGIDTQITFNRRVSM